MRIRFKPRIKKWGALVKNHTLQFVDRPLDKKAVGCNCVYYDKYKSNSTSDHYKARLVAKGYTLTCGVD